MTPSLFVCVPSIDGEIKVETANSLMKFARDAAFTVAYYWWNQDIVRVRSRAAREFLDGKDRHGNPYTHLLFIDNDVGFTPDVIQALVAAGKDLIGAVYPKKKIDWRSLMQASTPEESIRGVFEYPMVRIDGEQPEGELLRVACLPMGCTLMSRHLIETMTERYRDELTFLDKGGVETVALFHLMLEGKKLFPEDFSFCNRARACGFDAYCLLRPTSHTGNITLSVQTLMDAAV